MKAIDLHNHMREIGTWVDWEHSCDGFKAGAPEAEVSGIAVAWQSTFPALRHAHESGCNLFVTHEPTFYAHMEDDTSVFAHKHVRAKRDFIEETGIVIYRCHDVWDAMPGIGIVDSWAHRLGFECEPISSQRFYAVYPTEGTLKELAETVRQRVAELGQDSVQVIGDLNQQVSRVGIGTGAITHIPALVDLGADVVIATDDGIRFWATGAWAIDAGLPLIIVNHATSEESGIKNLACYIEETFPNVSVHHIPQGCMYRTI